MLLKCISISIVSAQPTPTCLSVVWLRKELLSSEIKEDRPSGFLLRGDETIDAEYLRNLQNSMTR
jgi:hypothetical protein